MVQDLVIHTAFGVAGIVTPKAVAAAAPGESMEKGLVLLDFVEMQIKESRPVTIQNGHPQTRLPAPSTTASSFR